MGFCVGFLKKTHVGFWGIFLKIEKMAKNEKIKVIHRFIHRTNVRQTNVRNIKINEK